MSDRAISDLVGFTLMFSIIIMSVAIVTAGGITSLSEMSDREQINSAERAMEVYSGSVADLTRQDDVVRQSTLSPSGGLIWLNDSQIHVEVETSGGHLRFDENIDLNATEHRFTGNPEDVTVAYEGGGVYRSDGGGAVVRPQWTCSTERKTAVLTFVKLRPGDDLAIGSGFGSDTGDLRPGGDELPDESLESTDSGVQFQMLRTGTEVHRYDGSSLSITVDPSDAALADQWAFYMERHDAWTDVSGGYQCDSMETVVLRIVTVEIDT